MAGLSEKMISALCVNNTLTSLKLARNGLRKVDFCFQIEHYFIICHKITEHCTEKETTNVHDSITVLF